MSTTVRVPASTSNLGAGFDCVGVAVDRWLTVSATLAAPGTGVQITRGGTLAAVAMDPTDDLIWQGVRAACAAAGREAPRDVQLTAQSEIPVGCGLGSSAAAIVAGAAVATALLELPLDRHAIATVCTALEGHPDNIVPAVFGGATLSVVRPEVPLVIAPLDVHPGLAFAFAIPDFPLATKVSRAALPATVPHATAVAAAARAAALVRGLATADGELLVAALDDVLHVPYRRGLVRGFDAVACAATRAGAFGATLSGAGAGMVAIAPAAVAAQVAESMGAAWRAEGVTPLTFQSAKPASGYVVQGAVP
ncbi:MAG: homoserine kinase [Gemmatimonadaceae bacterium]|nr:homoserine kinase [Gemmatimonadaceae bacterium]